MLFFIPLCDCPPVILPYFGPFMLTLGAYMLVFRCYAREQSNFQLLTASLNVMRILTYYVCPPYQKRQRKCTVIYDQDRSDEK